MPEDLAVQMLHMPALHRVVDAWQSGAAKSSSRSAGGSAATAGLTSASLRNSRRAQTAAMSIQMAEQQAELEARASAGGLPWAKLAYPLGLYEGVAPLVQWAHQQVEYDLCVWAEDGAKGPSCSVKSVTAGTFCPAWPEPAAQQQPGGASNFQLLVGRMMIGQQVSHGGRV